MMKRPRSLTFTAWVFIAAGLLAVWDMIDELLREDFSFHFGLVLIPIGYGLLKLQRMARACALGCLFLGWLLLACLVVLGFLGGDFHIGNESFRGWKRNVMWAGFCNAFGILLAWMNWVLLRRDVKTMFLTRSA